MIEMMKRIWQFGVDHYYRDSLGFELTCWFLGWFAAEVCAFSVLGWALWRWMPQVEKALDWLEAWWRRKSEA
jgi:hypothetical protein